MTNCGKTNSSCIYFYPDHPDAGRITQIKSINNKTSETQRSLGSNTTQSSLLKENKYLFCTYNYPDFGRSRMKGSLTSTSTKSNRTSIAIINQKAIALNESRIFTNCENSSLFCTYLYVGKSDPAGRKKKSNYTPAITETDEMVDDLRKTQLASFCTSTKSPGI